MLFPLLALDLHLSPMASSIKAIHALLAKEVLSRHISIGVVDVSQSIEGGLVASLGRNLPVMDSDFVVAKVVVFGVPDVVPSIYIAPQCAHSPEQSGSLLIHGYSVALVVDIPNAYASISTIELDSPDPTIKGFEVVFGYMMVTIPVKIAHN